LCLSGIAAQIQQACEKHPGALWVIQEFVAQLLENEKPHEERAIKSWSNTPPTPGWKTRGRR
jgi:hypothetical protein